MKNNYDVVVVGAGPAGSVAARRAAEAGLRTLLLEKRPEIGVPVRCAEAIGADLSKPFIKPDLCWIDATITQFALHNSKGVSVKLPPGEPTLVVNRKIFDKQLALLAEQAGAEVRTGTAAIGLITDENKVSGVRVVHSEKVEVILSRLVVAADGTESQVARWAGLKTVSPPLDYYVAAEYLLAGLDGRIDPQVCEYHLDHSLAPGGYLWTFPKGQDTANVGLVVTVNRVPSRAFELLDRFIAKRYPDTTILAKIAGGIPITGALKKMTANGLVVVGDAAHQADPLTGGGINLGMIGADMAMQVAVQALQNGEATEAALKPYEDHWKKRFGKIHTALYKVRKILTQMDQDRLDRLVEKAARLPVEKMSLGRIMLTLLKNDPALLLEAGKLIASRLILK
jgi:digeranylgeranylglycerophospholipid reductase